MTALGNLLILLSSNKFRVSGWISWMSTENQALVDWIKRLVHTVEDCFDFFLNILKVQFQDHVTFPREEKSMPEKKEAPQMLLGDHLPICHILNNHRGPDWLANSWKYYLATGRLYSVNVAHDRSSANCSLSGVSILSSWTFLRADELSKLRL